MPGLGKDWEQQRKLFIGGLDYRTTDDGLKAFYEQWGEIVDVIVMKDPQTKRSRGFGFVTYAKPDMVDEAMSGRPHVIDDREVEAKRAVPRDESGRMENNVTVKKVFIGGIKDEVTEDHMRNYFGRFGDIVSINMPIDKTTGKMRGFAFIEFQDYDSVDKIVLRKDHELLGKRVDAKKALSKAEMASLASGGGAAGGGRGRGRGGRGGGAGPWGEGGRGGGRGGGGGGGGWGGQQDGPWDNQGGYGGSGGGGYGGNFGGGGGYGNQGGFGGGGGGGYGGQGGQSGYSGGYGGQGGGGYGGQSGYGGQTGGDGGGGYDGGYSGGAGGGGGWGGNQSGGGGGGGWGGNQGGGPMKGMGQNQRSAPYNSGQRGGGGGYNRF